MNCNNLRLVLGLGLVRVSSRVRVRIRAKVRVSVMVRVSIRASWVANFVLFRCYRSVIYTCSVFPMAPNIVMRCTTVVTRYECGSYILVLEW